MQEIEITLKVKIGTLQEIGMGGFKHGWLNAERDGREFSLTCGAGCGTSFIEGFINAPGKPSLCAQTSIRPFATELFSALQAAQDEAAAAGEQAGS